MPAGFSTVTDTVADSHVPITIALHHDPDTNPDTNPHVHVSVAYDDTDTYDHCYRRQRRWIVSIRFAERVARAQPGALAERVTVSLQHR